MMKENTYLKTRDYEEYAFQLVNFYETNLQEVNGESSEARQLAKVFAIDHCDRMITFIDSVMQGWCDTDLISFWKLVKQNIIKY